MESEAVLLDRFLVVAFSIKGCVGRHEEGKGFLSISVGSWESSEDSSISLPWNFQVCFISDLVFFRFLPPILYFRESNFQSLGFRLLTHFYLCFCPIFGVHYSTICMLTKGELPRSFRYSHPIRTNGRECGALSKF